MAQCILISGCGVLEITHLLGDATCSENKRPAAKKGKRVKPTYHEPRLLISVDQLLYRGREKTAGIGCQPRRSLWRDVGRRVWMGYTIWNGRRSSWHDTIAVEMGYRRRGWWGWSMVRGRMEGMGLMETKVSAGLTGSVPN